MKCSEDSSEACSFPADFHAVCSQFYGNFEGPVTLSDRRACFSNTMESSLFPTGEEKFYFLF